MAYQRVRLLGSGGFGQVWLERDDGLGRECAAKYLDVAQLPAGLDPFAEAKQMLMAGHDHVVQVYSADTEGGIPVIRMEFLAAGSVVDAFGTGALPVATALGIVIDACRGVAHLHMQGLLHRDLKPGNLLVAADGRRKVSDFGLACAQSDPLAGVPAAYWQHVPPESWPGPIDSVAGDVYALGMTLHRLLCGDVVTRRPLVGAGDVAALVRSGMFPDRTAPGPHVGRAVRRVLDKALDVRPDRRFATAREMRLALERALPVVSWAASTQRRDAWNGVTTDGGLVWSARVEPAAFGTWQLKVTRATDGRKPRAVTSLCAQAPSRAQLQPAVLRSLETVAYG